MTTAIFCLLVLVAAMLAFVAWRTAQPAESERLKIEKARLEAELAGEQVRAAEKLKLLQDAEARLTTEFENLANRIFEAKGNTLAEQNRERISGLLQPFKEQLESFRGRIEAVHRDNTQQSAQLVEQVRQLQAMSNKVSDEANSLAKAIKGEAKQQGLWGELMLERILEASGLERGRDYESQKAEHAEDGSRRQPDFVVHLPGNKDVIIDAKVSITAYEQFCGAADDGIKAAALSRHLVSVRNHVEELRAKDYSGLLGRRALDFVIMCIPLEPAYQAALQTDQELLYDLAKTNIVLTGPATLMITLKLIAQIWRREYENRNAEVIAERAGRIYDQVALIVEAMTDAQKKLVGVSESFETALRRLTDGKGNLVARVEEIRRLGAKVNRQLPASLVDKALADAGGSAGQTPAPEKSAGGPGADEGADPSGARSG